MGFIYERFQVYVIARVNDWFEQRRWKRWFRRTFGR